LQIDFIAEFIFVLIPSDKLELRAAHFILLLLSFFFAAHFREEMLVVFCCLDKQ